MHGRDPVVIKLQLTNFQSLIAEPPRFLIFTDWAGFLMDISIKIHF